MIERVATGLTEAWRAYMRSLERIGRSLESTPGWRYLEQTLDDLAWGVSAAIGILWLLRGWVILMCIVAFIATR